MSLVQKLPQCELVKSETWRKFINQCGMCQDCKEWCSILEPYCDGGVSFEGAGYHFNDLWTDIEFEIEEANKEKK